MRSRPRTSASGEGAAPRVAIVRRGLAGRAAYISLLALATLSPFAFEPGAVGALDELRRALRYTPRDAVDAARNLALFAGWGALWVVTSRARVLAPGAARSLLGGALLTGLVLGLAAESLQLWIPERTTSPLDVLTNGVGSGLGALLVLGMVRAMTALRARKSYVGVPAASFLGAYLGAVVIEMSFPLLIPPIAGMHGGPLRRARASFGELRVESLLAIPVTDALLLVPLGLFAVAFLRESGRVRDAAVRTTIAFGAALSVLAELAHAPLGLPMRLGAIVTHAGAIAVGAVAARRVLPTFTQRLRGGARPGALLVAYVMVLGLWMWRPFVPVLTLEPFLSQLVAERLIPLYSLGARVDLYSVADIGRSFFLCLPVGGLLAVWPLRRAGPLAGALPGVYVAAALEFGQLFLLDRFFDLTDVLVQAAAVGIGWVIIREAGYRPYGELWSGWKPARAATAEPSNARTPGTPAHATAPGAPGQTG